METLLYNISQVLGITILHSLWQGLLLYAVIRLLLIGFPAISAAKKYNLLYTALLAMGVWFAYTFFMEAKLYNWTAPVAQYFTSQVDITTYNTPVPTITQQVEQPFYYNYKQLIKTYLPYISVLYLLSVVINLVRLAMGWQSIRKIRKQATAAHTWQPLTDKLAERAGILKHVQISFSNLIDVPCAFGYIKPILLLPVSISTQLSAEEIEVIILHELAHIKNNDYILNLIQQIIALLLFLNPFAQLVSKMIDLERENRCDDTVLQIGDPLTYAGALVKLEKTRQSNLQLAMAATGKKYHLFARIQRIMGEEKPAVNIKHLVFGMLILIGSLGSIAWLNPEIKDGRLSSKNGEAAVQQLAKIVREVIAPNAPEKLNTADSSDKMATNTVADSANKVAIVDSTEIKKAERERLLAEYVRLSRQLDQERKEFTDLPVYKEYVRNVKIRDSLSKTKFADRLTPAILKEREKNQELQRAFYLSPGYLKNKAEWDRISEAHYKAIKQQPEMVEFQKEFTRLRDSTSKSLMQTYGLTGAQLESNAEWKTLYQNLAQKENLIRLKISTVPEIKALYDSSEYARRTIYNSPDFEELSKKTKPSQEYIDATNSPEVVRQRAIVSELYKKFLNTPESRKVHETANKRDEIEQKIKQYKP
jgi:bla regulator protein blaR1